MMTHLLFTVTLTLVLLASQPPNPLPQPQQPATKFDEFGDIMYSDLKARLDNFAVMLQERPETLGFIIVYRSRRDIPGLSHSLALRMRHYLTETNRLLKKRLVIVDGGVAAHLTQELWIVPPGKAPTPRADVRIGVFQYSDSAWKFFEYVYHTQEDWTRLGYGKLDTSDPDHLEAYANEVRKKPGYIACLIAYAQYNARPGMVDHRGDYEPKLDTRLDPPGVAGRRLALEKRFLTDVYGVPSTRIRTINGGYRKRRMVELWIVPAGEPMPIATPNSFPTKRGR